MVRQAHTLVYHLYLNYAIGQHIPGHPLLKRTSHGVRGLLLRTGYPSRSVPSLLGVAGSPSEGTCRPEYRAVLRGFEHDDRLGCSAAEPRLDETLDPGRSGLVCAGSA